jgi:NADPH:quinone reductase-like Zn-dependent oxidoreductase
VKAATIHRFGPPDVIEIDQAPIPEPKAHEVLVKVAAAGVGPWDALIREKTSAVDIALPFTPGSDLSGTVISVGNKVDHVKTGDAIYGATNPQFIGASAEYAVVSAGMIASKPRSLTFIEAASAPIVAVTAWQMLFDYAKCQPGQSILIHGAAGSVGAYAVQLARQANLQIFATVSARNADAVKNLGANMVLDYKTARFEDTVGKVDIVLDLVGGETRKRSFAVVKPGGIVVSAVSNEPPGPNVPSDVRSIFFLVEVTTQRLERLTALFDSGKLQPGVGTVLTLDKIREAHEMLAGAPHKTGKIVLKIADQ